METTGRSGVSGLVSADRQAVREAEWEARSVARQAIYAKIKELLPPEGRAGSHPPLTRPVLITILHLCRDLDALKTWPGWCEAVRVAALMRYLNDGDMRAVLWRMAAPLYEREPDAWDDE